MLNYRITKVHSISKIEDMVPIEGSKYKYIDVSSYVKMTTEDKEGYIPHYWAEGICFACGKKRRKHFLIAKIARPGMSDTWIKVCNKKELQYAILMGRESYE